MCRRGVNRVANLARYLWKSVEADICLAQVAQCRGHDLAGGVVIRHRTGEINDASLGRGLAH